MSARGVRRSSGPWLSPYPWRDTLRWPAWYLRPSTAGRSAVRARPRAHAFPPDPGASVSALFVGDLMCMARDRVPQVDRRIRDLVRSADLVIGNCEAPLTRTSRRPRASYRFTFQMAEEYLAEFLERLGAEPARTALSVANNHIGDRGAGGLAETVGRLERLGVTPVGQRRTNGPVAPVSAGPVKLGIVAWTHWLNRGADGREAPDALGGGAGVWRHDDVLALTDASWASEKARAGVDCLIGAPHWGLEFHHFPDEPTRRSARALCRAGFDILVGHHPHVLQPVEWHDRALCLYSIGNLNGPRALLASWPSRLQGMFEVRLSADASDRGCVSGYRLHPFVQRNLRRGVRLEPLDRASAAAEKFDRRLRLLYPAAPGQG